MNMKKSFIGILAATIILSGCGTSQMAVGDPNAVLAGAAIGSNVGGAIGGLI
ncbi:glycine zipper family protein, partial [Bacteroides uniformis]